MALNEPNWFTRGTYVCTWRLFLLFKRYSPWYNVWNRCLWARFGALRQLFLRLKQRLFVLAVWQYFMIIHTIVSIRAILYKQQIPHIIYIIEIFIPFHIKHCYLMENLGKILLGTEYYYTIMSVSSLEALAVHTTWVAGWEVKCDSAGGSSEKGKLYWLEMLPYMTGWCWRLLSVFSRRPRPENTTSRPSCWTPGRHDCHRDCLLVHIIVTETVSRYFISFHFGTEMYTHRVWTAKSVNITQVRSTIWRPFWPG